MSQCVVALVIDADGNNCGEHCAAEMYPRAGAYCRIFATRLDLAESGKLKRCEACLRASVRMLRERGQLRQGAPDIGSGGRGNWRKELRRQL